MNSKAWLIAFACTANCITALAAEPIIDPQDKPKTSAAQSARRTEAKPVDKRATASSARRAGVEQGKVREIIEPADRTRVRPTVNSLRSVIEPQDKPGRTGVEQGKVREIIEPEDRTRARPTVNGLRSGVEPQDKPPQIVNPQDQPRQLLGPNNRSGRDKTTSSSLQSIEGGSVGVPSVTVGDVVASTRGRWRALAEELALGLVGNCVGQLTNPDRADPRIEDPEFRNPTPTGGCPALPRRDR